MNPDILDAEYVRKCTPNVELKIELKDIPHKGMGIVAKELISPDEIIALYRIRVFRVDTYESPTHDDYVFAVYTKGGNESKVWIGDLDEGSLQPPIKANDGDHYIPYWAYFTNEPAPGQKTNAWIDMNLEENYDLQYRKRVKEGEYMIYKLVARKHIAAGEEILWYYGTEYLNRDYPVSTE